MKHIEPITTTTTERNGALQHTHPSFGMVSVSNCSGNVDLFGSEVGVSSFLSLKVHTAEVNQDNGNTRYTQGDCIAEVMMTPVQYAEMISNPNSTGVPCTVRYTEKLGHIAQEHMSSKTVYAESEVHRRAEEVKQQASTIEFEVNTALSKKGAMTSKDKDAIKELVRKLAQNVHSNFDHSASIVAENIERAKMEAKTEISHHITHAINSAGVAALQDPEVARLAFNTTRKAP